MDTAQIFTIALVIVIGAIVVYGLGYFSGRLYGYRQGLEQGKLLSARVHHLKGMTDGYVMALQHTPAQRHEYMNNVLIRTGAMTPADVDADRRRRIRMQLEG